VIELNYGLFVRDLIQGFCCVRFLLDLLLLVLCRILISLKVRFCVHTGTCYIESLWDGLLLLSFPTESIFDDSFIADFIRKLFFELALDPWLFEIHKATIVVKCPAFFNGVILLKEISFCDASKLVIRNTSFSRHSASSKHTRLLLSFLYKKQSMCVSTFWLISQKINW